MSDFEQKEKKSNNKKNNYIFWIYGLIFIGLISFTFIDFTGEPTKIESWAKLKKMIQNKNFKKILLVNNEKVELTLKKDIYKNKLEFKDRNINEEGPHYYYEISSPEAFHDRLNEAQKNIPESERIYADTEKRINFLSKAIEWLLPLAFIILIWIFIMRRMTGGIKGGGGGIFNIGKSKAKIFDKDGTKIKINFNDVAGLEEAKIEISEIVDFLKNPKKYTHLGGKIPKGALLIGPPGTGKTLLAKAVAGEADVPFFSMSGSDFVEMFVGVGASRVRDLFAQAKSKAPCIIFIDEIDAIGRARGRGQNFSSNDERENTLNQLLTEMDGFDTNTGVIILAATNRADVLDPALLRAGRFDRQIHVELPDLNEREEIFKVHLKPIKIDENIEISTLAKQTPGFSGADIANACNESALIAARKGKKSVEKQDFLDAVDRIIGGLEKRNKIITPNEKKTIAFHEAGHATVSWLLEHASPLIKVTIVPRGKALGAAWYLPEERQLTTIEQINDEICALLGGRVAEEIIFGQISTGAMNDLERVTKHAYGMVVYYGMSPEIGNISFFDSSGRNEYSFNKPYSEKTAELIDKEVKKIVDLAYQKTKKILSDNISGLTQLAELLLEKEVIFTDDVKKIFGKRKGKQPFEDETNKKKEKKIKQEIEQEIEQEIKNIDNKVNNNLNL